MTHSANKCGLEWQRSITESWAVSYP